MTQDSKTQLTPKRFAKIKNVLHKRRKDLTLVLENIHDSHNVSAILRTADAIGIGSIYLIYNTNKYPKIGIKSSASAKKWIELVKFDNVKDCFVELKKEKFKIYSTYVNKDKKNFSLYDLDLTKRIALVFGNEHEGVSEDVKKYADKNFVIPMYGMVQSLNVSVAAAVCMYEALRQRQLKGKYKRPQLTKMEVGNKIKNYSLKTKLN